MLGILASIIRLLGKTYYQIVLESDKQKSRYEAIQDKADTYFDNSGAEWFIMSNGKDIKCMRTTDLKTHHDVLEALPGQGVPTWTILKDYTEIQLKKEDDEFHKRYTEAKTKAIENGKKYFFVNVVGDHRAGLYEVDTDRQFKINYDMNMYVLRYYKSTKNKYEPIDSEIISKEKAMELGGISDYK